MHDEEVRFVNRNKKKREGLIITMILLLVVLIGIGYAALSRTLNISGKSTIAKSTWNIYFDQDTISAASSDGVTVNSAPTVSADDDGNNTKITYDVTLSQPGDYYEFTVAVKNGGTIDAVLDKNPTITAVSSLGDDVSNYFNYTVTEVANGKDNTISADDFTVKVNEVRTIKVRVEYKYDIDNEYLQTANKEFDGLTFTMSFSQAEK
jgi:hypothetical protein